MVVRGWDGNIKFLTTLRSSFPDPNKIHIRKRGIRTTMTENQINERINTLRQEARELIRAIRGG